MDNNTEKLLGEIQTGEMHRAAWNETVLPFYQLKEHELFDAFCTAGTDNKELLIDIKMQHNVLKAMQASFESYIQTGQMAEKQLFEMKENEEGKKQ